MWYHNLQPIEKWRTNALSYSSKEPNIGSRSSYGAEAGGTFDVASSGVEGGTSSAIASSKYTDVGLVGVSGGRWSPIVGDMKAPPFSSLFLRRLPWLRGPGFGLLLYGMLIPPCTWHAFSRMIKGYHKIVRTMSNRRITALLGCAPTDIQYLTLSTLHSTFFTFSTSGIIELFNRLPSFWKGYFGNGISGARGIGSNTPTSSMGFALRATR
jgi:hypothetical protein